jgi:adenylate cyclase
MLVEFHSVVDAVTCAAEVQRRMARRNADVFAGAMDPVPHRHQPWRRDHRGERYFRRRRQRRGPSRGARRAGGICVSGAVRDQVNHRLDDIAFEDIGEQNVKNITARSTSSACDWSRSQPRRRCGKDGATATSRPGSRPSPCCRWST